MEAQNSYQRRLRCGALRAAGNSIDIWRRHAVVVEAGDRLELPGSTVYRSGLWGCLSATWSRTCRYSMAWVQISVLTLEKGSSFHSINQRPENDNCQYPCGNANQRNIVHFPSFLMTKRGYSGSNQRPMIFLYRLKVWYAMHRPLDQGLCDILARFVHFEHT